ncbi:hypothetical protein [Sutcliffiella sp. NC1]|uniref:hypothetical protein n=1 Tax=Sutcliffiella sp. NC1 TaxID=3004096 RepID=UPI0022DE39A4|nr:hypothetical protein [Sutcliffiella sp. NC1]WBL13618.1 hypothetical protein O1A01_17065 [Sutcliffiella sp. NC1]
MQQQLTYKENPQEVLSLLQSVEPEIYQVKSVSFTSFFESDGLYWMEDKKDVNNCLHDVVLMLEHSEGDTFYASGTVQLANGDEKDSYLQAYPINNADERIESGLYQGVLSVHPKVYSSKGCS